MSDDLIAENIAKVLCRIDWQEPGKLIEDEVWFSRLSESKRQKYLAYAKPLVPVFKQVFEIATDD